MVTLTEKLERLRSISPAARNIRVPAPVVQAVEKVTTATARRAKTTIQPTTMQDVATQGAGSMQELLLRANPFIGPLIMAKDILFEGETQTPAEFAIENIPITPAVDPNGNIITRKTLDDIPAPVIGQNAGDKIFPTIPFPELPDITGGIGDKLLIGGIALAGVYLLGQMLGRK